MEKNQAFTLTPAKEGLAQNAKVLVNALDLCKRIFTLEKKATL